MPTLPVHRLRHPDGRRFHIYGPLEGSLDGQSAEPTDHSHLHQRFDVLSGTWVAVSPARNTRPGGVAGPFACPLCPGGPELPFAYGAAVFDNRFPSFVPDAPEVQGAWRAPSSGRCEVIVYTQSHEGSLGTLPESDVARVVALWRDRTTALWAAGHALVMAFENRGAEVGATLPHPHGQLYAFDRLPLWSRVRVQALVDHRDAHGECAGCRVLGDTDGQRTVERNDSFLISVPFAARWPLEVRIMARRHGLRRLADLSDAEAIDLARAIQHVVRRYDGVYGFELPYMLQVLEAPDGADDWHLQIEFEPPHRAADKLKVRASVETSQLLFINDTLPEESAARLRAIEIEVGNWTGVVVPQVVEAVGSESTGP